MTTIKHGLGTGPYQGGVFLPGQEHLLFAG